MGHTTTGRLSMAAGFPSTRAWRAGWFLCRSSAQTCQFAARLGTRCCSHHGLAFLAAVADSNCGPQTEGAGDHARRIQRDAETAVAGANFAQMSDAPMHGVPDNWKIEPRFLSELWRARG